MKKENIINKYCRKLVSNRTRCIKCGSEMFACVLSDYNDDVENLNPFYIKARFLFKKRTAYSKALINKKIKSKLKRARGATNPHPKRIGYKILCMCEKCESYDTYRGASSITMVNKFKR